MKGHAETGRLGGDVLGLFKEQQERPCGWNTVRMGQRGRRYPKLEGLASSQTVKIVDHHGEAYAK